MAKNRNRGKSSRPAGVAPVQSSTARPQGPTKPAKGDGQVHVKVPAADVKAAAMQQPTEPVAAPVVQVPPAPPAASTTETWADPLADNSSYATADSDDPSSRSSTPPAAASTGAVAAVTQGVPAAVAPMVWPDLSDMTANTSTSTPAQGASVPSHPAMYTDSEAVTAKAPPAAPTAEVTSSAIPAQAPAPAAPAALTAACRPYDMADEAAVLNPAAGATAAGSWAGQCLDWLLCAYTYPVSMQPQSC